MNNKISFKEFMAGAGEIFDKQVTPILSKMYWKSLEPFTDEQCRKAFNLAIERCKFFPKPAELIELIRGSSKQIEQEKDDKALIIANEIMEQARRYSPGHPLKLNDPIAQHLMTSRWPYHNWATTVLESELKWWVKEFCEAYNAYSATGVPMQLEVSERLKSLIKPQDIA